MRLLLDECVSPSLSSELEGLSVDALPLRNRGMLRADDHVVWKFAQAEERAVVTINAKDFRRLAEKAEKHHGLIVVPSGGTREEQLKYVKSAVHWARGRNAFNPNFLDMLLEVDEEGQVTAAKVSIETTGMSSVIPLKTRH